MLQNLISFSKNDTEIRAMINQEIEPMFYEALKEEIEKKVSGYSENIHEELPNGQIFFKIKVPRAIGSDMREMLTTLIFNLNKQLN